MESSSPPSPPASSPPSHHRPQEQSTRVLWIGSRAAGTLRFQIQCCESFHGELLNNEEGEAHVDRTGLLLWPGSFLLCAYLSAARAEVGEAAKHVIELGAGATGLAGLLVSHFPCVLPVDSAARITTLTDGDPESVALLGLNAKHHHQGGEKQAGSNDSSSNNNTLSMAPTAQIGVQRLRWGNQEEADALVSGDGRAASLVLGSDILYPSTPLAVIHELLQSVRALLEPNDSNTKTTTQEEEAATTEVTEDNGAKKLKGLFVLSFFDRDNKATLRNLLLALREERFQMEDVVAGRDLFADEKEGFVVEEEEEEEEGRGVRRRSVQMMGGGRVLVLRPLPMNDDENGESAAATAAAAAEARWFRDIWEVAPPSEVEEWQAPLMSDDDKEEEETEEKRTHTE